MSTIPNHTYYFLFSYHRPGVWEEIQHDQSFDFESIGVLAINAPNEAAALEWGKHLAAWYVSKLYLDYPELTYNWPPDDCAYWVETSMPEGCENRVKALGEIQFNSYPDFDKLRAAMQR